MYEVVSNTKTKYECVRHNICTATTAEGIIPVCIVQRSMVHNSQPIHELIPDRVILFLHTNTQGGRHNRRSVCRMAYPELDLRDVRWQIVDDEIVLAGRSSCLSLSSSSSFLVRLLLLFSRRHGTTNSKVSFATATTEQKIFVKRERRQETQDAHVWLLLCCCRFCLSSFGAAADRCHYFTLMLLLMTQAINRSRSHCLLDCLGRVVVREFFRIHSALHKLRIDPLVQEGINNTDK